MSRAKDSKILLIGIGNIYRRDDAAGLVAARLLKEQVPKCCSVIEHTGEGAALMELWKDVDCTIVIDAVRSGAAPGTVSRFDANPGPLPSPMFRDSTHAFGFVEAIELSRTLNQLPRHLVVYGVEGQNFDAGSNLSPAMQFAIQDVVQRVLWEITQIVSS